MSQRPWLAPFGGPLSSAAELAAVLDHVPSLVSLWDLDLRNRFTNWASVDWLGVPPRQFVGRPISECLSADDLARDRPFLEAALAGEARSSERAMACPSGPRHVLVNHTPYLVDGAVTGVVVLVTDISDEARVDSSRREIANRIAVVAERERLAAEMEDAVVGRLAAVSAQLVAPDLFAPEAREPVDAAAELIDTAVAQLRSSIYHDRRIAEPDELAAAVTEVIDTASRTLGFRPNLVLSDGLDRVTPIIGEEILAVLNESLSNVARHAEANRVDVTLAVEVGEVSLVVADDGRGFARARRRSGLANMKARAGRLGGVCKWRTNASGGTTVEWRAPVDRRGRGRGARAPWHNRRSTDRPLPPVSVEEPNPVRPDDTVQLTAPELADILDFTPAMITSWDADLRIQFANRPTVEWFGIDRDEMMGRTFLDLLGRDLARANLPFARAALAGEAQRFERTMYDRGGRPRHTRVAYVPRRVGGEVCGFFVQISDVTGRVRAEDQLRESAEQMTVLNERRRIAEDLHDLVIQHLFAAGLKLHAASTLGPPADGARIDAATAEVDSAIAELRHSIVSLRAAPEDAEPAD